MNLRHPWPHLRKPMRLLMLQKRLRYPKNRLPQLLQPSLRLHRLRQSPSRNKRSRLRWNPGLRRWCRPLVRHSNLFLSRLSQSLRNPISRLPQSQFRRSRNPTTSRSRFPNQIPKLKFRPHRRSRLFPKQPGRNCRHPFLSRLPSRRRPDLNRSSRRQLKPFLRGSLLPRWFLMKLSQLRQFLNQSRNRRFHRLRILSNLQTCPNLHQSRLFQSLRRRQFHHPLPPRAILLRSTTAWMICCDNSASDMAVAARENFHKALAEPPALTAY